ncbi:Esterase E4 [Folsomia candida]|uniref:Esterase E4 n=1 Tax=Folsomia candida TaxID=158441 RepID=A0A226E3B4_FOLCA|nr:Esterase E4 [Folsomia candida]
MAVLFLSPSHVSFCRLLVLYSCGLTFLGVSKSFVRAQREDYDNPDDVTFRWVPVSDTGGGGVGERRRVRVYGTVSNFTAGNFMNTSYATFYGIPFALAPTSHLRFTRPTLRYLDKDFRATVPPLGCPQLFGGGGGGMIGSEDCLQLNVYVPTMTGGDSMPVLVWIHGDNPDRLTGAKVLAPLTSGKAMDIDPAFFMPGRMVVVVPQYRLGTLGFASTVNEDLSGNSGLFDILLSLEWVAKFISHFSGDPGQVTLLGGSLVGLLATTELGRGFFQRVILMGGGSPISPLIAVDPTPKVTYGEVALQNGCPSFPSSHFVRCMQARRVGSIVEADARLAVSRYIFTYEEIFAVFRFRVQEIRAKSGYLQIF